MSTQLPPRPREFKPGTGDNRYARFAESWLDVERTHVLDTVLEALDGHQKIVVIGGNGVGKSYMVSAGGLSALYANYQTIVHVTAGTASTLKNNIWKPARGLFKDAKRRWGEEFPGRKLDGTREIRTEMGEKWYYECVSPAYPDDLEGPHNDHVIYFIEEADKPGVTAEHIDSVRSTVTDKDDRVCVVANPPTDDANVVSELIESENWHTIRFPSWDSQNVRIERGLESGDEIGGLATSWKIQEDWEEYHSEPWPGLEQVIEWSTPFLDDERTEENPEFRDDLDELWYKRRAGIRPPQNAAAWRPFSIGDVREAFERPLSASETSANPSALGIDVARSGDSTVMKGVHGKELRTHYDKQGTNHAVQKQDLKQKTAAFDTSPKITVDAVGEGSGLADDMDMWFPNVTRFSNGGEAAQSETYRDCWAEGLAILGRFLRDGGSFSDTTLRRELLAAARVVKFSERHLKSRGRDGAKVVEATSKDEIKDMLDGSPDHLDSALMACWVASDETSTGNLTRRTPGSAGKQRH